MAGKRLQKNKGKTSAQSSNGVWRLVLKGAVIQYLVTGIIVFYADYLTFYIGFNHFDLTVPVAQAPAYVVGIVVNFILERAWVFKNQTKRDPIKKETRRYAIVLVINYAITVVILEVLERYGISPNWGKYLAAFFFTFWNYVVFRFWVFKGPEKKHLRKKHR